MKYSIVTFSLLTVISSPLRAQDIDLECEALAEQMIERLLAEDLLDSGAAEKQRAREIGMELCSGAEVSAQEQHEVKKQKALDNWLWESKPEKPGNKRLKNLKR